LSFDLDQRTGRSTNFNLTMVPRSENLHPRLEALVKINAWHATSSLTTNLCDDAMWLARIRRRHQGE
jgi:hypothetical protein